MAIIDSNLIFGKDVDITTGGLIADAIDLASFEASGARDAIARGDPVWWVNHVTLNAAGGTSMSFDLKHHHSAGMSESVGEILVQSPVVQRDDLHEDFYWVTTIPVLSPTIGRYIGAVAHAFGTFTALKVTSYLTTALPPFRLNSIKDWR